MLRPTGVRVCSAYGRPVEDCFWQRNCLHTQYFSASSPETVGNGGGCFFDGNWVQNRGWYCVRARVLDLFLLCLLRVVLEYSDFLVYILGFQCSRLPA